MGTGSTIQLEVFVVTGFKRGVVQMRFTGDELAKQYAKQNEVEVDALEEMSGWEVAALRYFGMNVETEMVDSKIEPGVRVNVIRHIDATPGQVYEAEYYYSVLMRAVYQEDTYPEDSVVDRYHWFREQVGEGPATYWMQEMVGHGDDTYFDEALSNPQMFVELMVAILDSPKA